jgi:hypothetical protein
MAEEKKKGIKGLVLRGGGNIAGDSQIGEEVLYILSREIHRSHVYSVAFKF